MPAPLHATSAPLPMPEAAPTPQRVTATLLGTGTSTGIPVIGCNCRVCTSSDPRDQRLRCSAHIVAETEAGPVHLQIDTGPDFRTQALRFGVEAVDALLVTHHHFDHVVGMDDLRPYFFRVSAPIPVAAPPNTEAALRRMFGYIFEDGSYPGISKLDLRAEIGPFTVESRTHPERRVTVTPIPAFHGTLPLYGYRVGGLAYLTDVSALPDTSYSLLDDLDVLVLDALRHEPHPTHFSFSEALEVAARIGAKDTVFVHMTHSILHAEEDAALPDGVRLGYDGLVLTADG
ncbi:MAG: MBL fold metallo-hydrolase [Bacteroidota bacterium]